MIATSEAELREQVFALRGQNPPVSFQKIADQLGISKGVVYRLFHQPAKATAEPGNGVGLISNGHSAEYQDPVLAAAAARLEAKKIELQEKQLDRQLALLDGKSAGGDAGMTMVLLNQMQRMQEDVDRKLALGVATAKPAEDPMQAMVRGMGMLAELQQKASILAPPPAIPAAVSAADVELRVLLEKMNLESETIRQRAAQQTEMWNRAWGMAEKFGPMILEGFKNFLDAQAKRQEAPMATLQVLPGGQTVPVNEVVEEIPMTCASCAAKAMVRPEAGEIPACPRCGGVLQPDAGPPAPKRPSWPEEATFG